MHGAGPDAAAAGASPVHEHRRLAAGLRGLGIELPVVLAWDGAARGGDPLLAPALVLGSLLCDGIGDAVAIRASDSSAARPLAFNILQAARVRISKTEFISCPSCGRTLFDLEETTRRIKSRTAHLKGLKIAIMGCVVNGPGEMADADFGYVGCGAGKIALFVGKELVARDIPTGEADDRLVELIRAHGKWQDPPSGAETRD
jgi:(E)-4-hydroxy-3-methylbut-2-enyl-diphosphate synthase